MGAPPGTCGVVIDASEKISSAKATPTSLTSPVDLSSMGFAPAGTVILGPGQRAGGMPCGEYDVMVEFETGIVDAVVSVNSAETHVAMKAPAKPPPSSDLAIVPVVESTPPE